MSNFLLKANFQDLNKSNPITSAEFVVSSAKVEQCPKPDKPEYAFIGRSNVGKSSLINMLAERKNLAKTSSTPGKTQLINHFLINQQWYLADLPGYGYAKVSKQDRARWQKMIDHYIRKRENLMSLFVLIDSRIEPQKIDLEFLEMLGEKGIPFAIVFTKTDKLPQKDVSKNTNKFKSEMLKTWEELPPLFYTSATRGRGREEVLSYIDEVNQLFV